jgi:hypothetical protein
MFNDGETQAEATDATLLGRRTLAEAGENVRHQTGFDTAATITDDEA